MIMHCNGRSESPEGNNAVIVIRITKYNEYVCSNDHLFMRIAVFCSYAGWPIISRLATYRSSNRN